MSGARSRTKGKVGEREGCIPVVAHRRSASEWLAVLRLVDLLAILRESDYVAPGASAGSAGIPDDALHDEGAL